MDIATDVTKDEDTDTNIEIDINTKHLLVHKCIDSLHTCTYTYRVLDIHISIHICIPAYIYISVYSCTC